ncbi:MAG: NYN domain-containing protein [Candidatus Eisenbacteria bacterium]|nr:NYN domain-containing protein [Candidatus Eisenbacteria bacterium]
MWGRPVPAEGPPRVVCFIDGSNLYSHLRDSFGAGKVHLPSLCHKLAGAHRRLHQWRMYAAPVPQGDTDEDKRRYAGQQRFFEFVRRHRKGALRLARFQKDAHGILREKGVDVLLAVDLVRLAAEDAYDVAVVLSGDGDLVPAIKTVQEVYARRVEVALPDVPAYHVHQEADAYLEVTTALFEAVRR